MIKFLNEMISKEINPPIYFEIGDFIIGDEEKIFIDKKKLIEFHDDFCDIWDSKGHMQAKIESVMSWSDKHVLIRWEDNSKDWIPINFLHKYFLKIGKNRK